MIKLKEIASGKPLTFVRFGGLSSVPQKGYKPSTTGASNPMEQGFHSPPAKRGIYAFVKQAYERFLISGPEPSFHEKGARGLDPKWEYVKDRQGYKVVLPKEFGYEQKDYDALSKQLGIKLPPIRRLSMYPDIKTDTHYLTTLKEPKYFKYSGDIWSHLKEFVNHGDILKERGSWILTTSEVHREAFERALADKKRHNYVKDHLEVFIERVP